MALSWQLCVLASSDLVQQGALGKAVVLDSILVVSSSSLSSSPTARTIHMTLHHLSSPLFMYARYGRDGLNENEDTPSAALLVAVDEQRSGSDQQPTNKRLMRGGEVGKTKPRCRCRRQL